MKFNLNDDSLSGGGSAVFNNGIAGKVDGVKIDVTKRGSDENENAPDYKLVFTDATGLQVNQGFYYHKNNDMFPEEKNEANAGYLVGRVLSAAKAIVPEGFTFPDVEGKQVNEIIDILFNIIRENSTNGTVNIFTTYGTKTKPSQFLGLRFFDFIERGDTKYSKLREKGNDMMERLVEDAPKTSGLGDTGSSTTKPDIKW